MSLSELKAFPVRDYADKDCALFLWVTDPMIPQGIELMQAWGFTYKTVAFNWVKLNKNGAQQPVEDGPFFVGLGYWTRANPELCLLGTRGKPPRQAKDVRRLIVSERQQHSRKPIEIYDRIQRLVEGPYLELFAREKHQGWNAIGDQIDESNSGKYRRRQPSKIKSSNDLSKAVTQTYKSS